MGVIRAMVADSRLLGAETQGREAMVPLLVERQEGNEAGKPNRKENQLSWIFGEHDIVPRSRRESAQS